MSYYIQEGLNDAPLLETFKLMRKKFPNASVSSLILSAFSKAVESYLVEKNLEVPEKVTAITTFFVPNKLFDLENFFQNRFGCTFIDIPIKNSNFTNKKLSSYMDSSLSTFLLPYVPQLFNNLVSYSINSTLIFTNFPGPTKKTVVADIELTMLGAIMNNSNSAPITLMALSLEGKFVFGLNSYDSIFSNVDDVKKVLLRMIEEIRENMSHHVN